MTKRQSQLVVALLGGILAVLSVAAFEPDLRAGAAVADPPEAAGPHDPREPVVLNGAQHQYALEQMRGLLVTIRNLDAAKLADDRGAMIALAQAQGPGPKRAHPEGFHEALPDGFRAMSKAMRQAFGAMSDELTAGNIAGYESKRLEALDSCIGCHESYRFHER